MLEINSAQVTSDQLKRIQDLENSLGCEQYEYHDINSMAQQTHQVELPLMVLAKVGDVLQKAKNVSYKNSYSKRGLFSIFFNMERKWERIATQIFEGKQVTTVAVETFMDTCIDLAVYAMKMCCWICARRPDMYIQLLEQVYKEAAAVRCLPAKAAPQAHASLIRPFEG